jgi:coiled-coil domain-containing protein 63/114
MQVEFNEKKDKIKEMIPSEEDFHQQEVSRRHVLHLLANEKVRLNDTVGRNQYLKCEINIMRKEILFAQDSIVQMGRQIGRIKKEAVGTNKDYITGSKHADETNNQILALKAKHEEEKEKFELEIKKLQERLKERDEPIEFDDKTFNQSSGGAEKASGAAGGIKQEFANPIAILKLRLSKIITTNKEKKHLLDKYMRNARIIEDAFEQIREQSGGGLLNIEEIVTTFIKAEEQNRGLQTYVNLLNQETDALEERNRQLDDNIASFKSLVALSEADKQKKLQTMRATAEHLRREILRANGDCEDMQGEFTHLQSKVLRMVQHFKRSRFSLNVASNMNYDDNTQFNENNVIPYLAELEEYISALITYVAYKRDDPNAAISSVPLEKLPQKEFNKREIAIDAPVDTERDQSMMAARTDAGGDEEDMIVDSKQLYMKFLDMVGKKQINIVHQSQAKKGPEAQANNSAN